MPRLKPATQLARRAHILDAAELCFARQGFHRTTMQDICAAASVSAGAVYVYFRSKEDLIAGICERDRTKLAEQLAEIAEAPDLLQALGQLARHYAVEQPAHKRVLAIEMGLESTRNPAIAEIFRSTDRFCLDSFTRLLERAQAQGRIAPKLEPPMLARLLATIGDGIFWRRAIDPDHDPSAMITTFVDLVATIVNPIDQPDAIAPALQPSEALA